MNSALRATTAAALLALGTLALTAGTAQAAGSDNHHEYKPTVDCRQHDRAAGAILSPSVPMGNSTTVCFSNDAAHHPSHTSIIGLVNSV